LALKPHNNKRLPLTWQIHPGISPFLLDRLNELDLDHEADFCEKLHEDAERLYRSLSARLNEQQDGA
jgi:hypothetical protein